MGPADTYQLTRLNIEGFSVDDVHYVDSDGKRSVLHFNRVGQVIDLELVDVRRFVTSAVRGLLKELVDSGVLRTVQADISEKRHDELHAAYEEIKPYNFRQGFNTQARSVELEPGMGVAIGGPNPHRAKAYSVAASAARATTRLSDTGDIRSIVDCTSIGFLTGGGCYRISLQRSVWRNSMRVAFGSLGLGALGASQTILSWYRACNAPEVRRTRSYCHCSPDGVRTASNIKSVSGSVPWTNTNRAPSGRSGSSLW